MMETTGVGAYESRAQGHLSRAFRSKNEHRGCEDPRYERNARLRGRKMLRGG